MNKNRFIGTILGKQGSGKTFFTERQIILYLKLNSDRPIFILDTMDDYGSHDGGAYAVCFYSMLSMKKHLVKNKKNLTGIYVLKSDNDNDSNSFFELFTRVKEPCTIIIEEADKFCDPYSINEDLKNIIKYGRHWGQDLIFIARRPAELNRNVTAQSDFIVSFSQTEPRDLQSLKKSYQHAVNLSELNEENYEYMIFGNLPDRLNYLEKAKKNKTDKYIL